MEEDTNPCGKMFVPITNSAMTTSWLKKIRSSYKERRLGSDVYLRIMPVLRGARWIASFPTTNLITLHCPEYIEPSQDREEVGLVQRIFQSFKKMKEDQLKVADASLYQPSSLWHLHLEEGYSCLTSALLSKDPKPFHFFLTNFGTWKIYHGIEYSTFIRKNMISFLHRLYLKSDVFSRQLKIWKWFYNSKKPIACLSYPRYGNQAGAHIDGVFVGVNSFFMEIYGSLLSNIISDAKHPVVAELGAGYGKLAYFTLRNRQEFTLIDFDLPEILCLAAYYLMKVWPDKKVLLYGEEKYTFDVHNQYDLIFMPSFELQNTGRNSVDLFVNHCSLGEMTREAVKNYMQHISQATRYFFHMNHGVYPNIFSNDERSMLGDEYPVPIDRFKLLFRYPDIGHMLYQGGFDFHSDIFMYLYERVVTKE